MNAVIQIARDLRWLAVNATAELLVRLRLARLYLRLTRGGQ